MLAFTVLVLSVFSTKCTDEAIKALGEVGSGRDE